MKSSTTSSAKGFVNTVLNSFMGESQFGILIHIWKSIRRNSLTTKLQPWIVCITLTFMNCSPITVVNSNHQSRCLQIQTPSFRSPIYTWYNSDQQSVLSTNCRWYFSNHLCSSPTVVDITLTIIVIHQLSLILLQVFAVFIDCRRYYSNYLCYQATGVDFPLRSPIASLLTLMF